MRLYLFRPSECMTTCVCVYVLFLRVYTYTCTISHDGSYAAGWLLHAYNSSRKLGQNCYQLAVYNGRLCAAKLYDSSWPSSRRLIWPLPLPRIHSPSLHSLFPCSLSLSVSLSHKHTPHTHTHHTHTSIPSPSLPSSLSVLARVAISHAGSSLAQKPGDAQTQTQTYADVC